MRAFQPLLLAVLISACGGPSGGPGDGGSGGGDGGDLGPDGGVPCHNLQCFQVECPGGGTTSVTGVVYAPNGTLPLYGVTVYVPNGTPQPFPEGVTCDRCGSVLSGDPLVQTTTDTMGKFALTNMPATDEVPLVIQVGKWRRQVVVPTVPACVSTALGAAETRLPGNRSEGDIPRIALSTGGADALECLLRKIGLEDGEIGVMGGPERIHLYAGTGGTDQLEGGASFADSQQLWATAASLSSYDVVLMSCEAGQNPETKPPEALQALHDYTAAGGRVFASHWHNYWLEAGPAPWPQTATFVSEADLNDIVADIDTSFPKGDDLAEWLVNVGGSTTLGEIAITAAQHTVREVEPTLAQRWIYKEVTDNGMPSVQYLSFTTPLTAPEDMRCGRVVFSDIHVSSGDDSAPDQPFPSGCQTTELSPQEKVLAFMLFDIASCVGPGIP